MNVNILFLKMVVSSFTQFYFIMSPQDYHHHVFKNRIDCIILLESEQIFYSKNFSHVILTTTMT